MPIDATDFGDVSMLRDEPIPGDLTYQKVGGYCVHGVASGTMNPGDAVVVTSADDSYATTTSANSTAIAGCVVASLPRGMQWDYVSAIASGTRILVRIIGVAKMTASAAIVRGALVGTSTTAGRVVTTSTTSAVLGRALQTASAAGDQIRVLLRG